MTRRVVKAWDGVFNAGTQRLLNDIAALTLRVFYAGMIAGGHGLGKLQNFNGMMDKFSDPLGIGSPLSLTLAVFAEFFCAILVFFGFATRLAVIPLAITMIVAVFLVHMAQGDPFFPKMEFGLLYLGAFIAILLMGPGRFSVDHVIKTKMLKA